MAHTRAYRQGQLLAEGFPVDDVSDYLEHDDTVVWVDICEPTTDDLKQLAHELGLHELAVEDAVGPHQRPKLDHYASHMFLVGHAVQLARDSAELGLIEVDAFVGTRWLVTVRKSEGFALGPVLARVDRSPDLAHHGVGFLLYALLDVLVDGYFDAVGTFDDYYERVSEEIFSEHPIEPSEQRHWFQMRQSLVQFHRHVVPMREAVSGLMRRELGVVAEDLYPYYQDVYDHVLRVNESTDAVRELVGTIVETNLSLRDYRLNTVVKQVTSWAAIVAVPTLVTGYYGMNVPYPGSGQQHGVVVATGLVVGLSVALYLVFRRREWL